MFTWLISSTLSKFWVLNSSWSRSSLVSICNTGQLSGYSLDYLSHYSVRELCRRWSSTRALLSSSKHRVKKSNRWRYLCSPTWLRWRWLSSTTSKFSFWLNLKTIRSKCLILNPETFLRSFNFKTTSLNWPDSRISSCLWNVLKQPTQEDRRDLKAEHLLHYY